MMDDANKHMTSPFDYSHNGIQHEKKEKFFRW